MLAPSDLAEGDSVASAVEPAPSETVVNDDEFTADFTDEEVDVDAEVCGIIAGHRFELTRTNQVIEEDDDPDNSIADKTINVSVDEGTVFMHSE